MKKTQSRRQFLATATAAAPLTVMAAHGVDAAAGLGTQSAASPSDRIVDIHLHFDEKIPTFLDDFLRISDKLNLTACMLTPFAHRKVVAEAARKYPTKIVPFGFVELDAPDAAQQVKELHDLGYRGLGELEFPRKPFVDRSYDPVYELANEYSWIVLFHTGIVLREVFDKPEDVTSARMRPVHLEEIARRFPKPDGARRALRQPGIRVGRRGLALEPERLLRSQRLDAAEDAGTPEPLPGRLLVEWRAAGHRHAQQRPSAFIKLVFGSDT